ncbi:MAG: tetratricopeptide repeat protein [Bacteroidales bacterium]|nr:tetratricopeptide repeat protein [Bacteroidales bacterium]
MKKMRQNYLISTIIAALVMSGCAGLSKMRDSASTVGYEVNPNPLEMHGDQTLHDNAVAVAINTRFPEKYFNKKAVVVATPVLKYEGGEKTYPSTTLQGEKVDGNNRVIPYAGGNYSYTGTIPYEDAMMQSQLVVRMSASINDKEPLVWESPKIADGVLATPALVQVVPKTVIMPDNFQRIIPEAYTADIHYVINQSNVRSSELRADDIVKLEEDMVAAEVAENIEIKGAEISAYASPDGPLDLNTRLSENRESTAQRYLERALRDNKITEAEAANFLNMMSTPEDWNGFRELMEASDIQDKDLILRVLSMYSDPVVREREIKNISQAYEEIAEKILPQLRRSVMTINVDVIGKSDSEIMNLVRVDPDSLNVEEILFAATLTDNLNEKAAIYEAAARIYPECIRAHNNLGNIYLQLDRLDEAKASLEAAQKIDDTDAVKANLGAVALAERDISTAEQLLTSAMSAGSEVSYNLGIIKIIQGDYAAAVNYFGNEPSFNAALAQMLSGNNDRAMTTLNQLGDVKDASVYYLKAIAAARSGNNSAVFSNLRSAISLDSSLKEHAQKDAEFLGIASDATFMQIIQ